MVQGSIRVTWPAIRNKLILVYESHVTERVYLARQFQDDKNVRCGVRLERNMPVMFTNICRLSQLAMYPGPSLQAYRHLHKRETLRQWNDQCQSIDATSRISVVIGRSRITCENDRYYALTSLKGVLISK